MTQRKIPNFFEYVIQNGFLTKEGKFKCQSCKGSGKIYDPNETPDPYEGNKLRSIVTCTTCGGLGSTDENFYREKYLNFKQNIITENKKTQDHNYMVNQIKKKLTSKEIKFIEENGLHAKK